MTPQVFLIVFDVIRFIYLHRDFFIYFRHQCLLELLFILPYFIIFLWNVFLRDDGTIELMNMSYLVLFHFDQWAQM